MLGVHLRSRPGRSSNNSGKARHDLNVPTPTHAPSDLRELSSSSGTRDWEAIDMRIHVHSHCKSDELTKSVAHIPATTAYPFIFQHFGICHVTNDDAMGDPWADIEAILRVIYQSMVAVH